MSEVSEAMTTVTDRGALQDALGLLKDREEIAARLLESSAKHSFDPDKELDWDAPPIDGKYYWPPELLSSTTPRCGRRWARSSASTSPATRRRRWARSASGSRSS